MKLLLAFALGLVIGWLARRPKPRTWTGSAEDWRLMLAWRDLEAVDSV